MVWHNNCWAFIILVLVHSFYFNCEVVAKAAAQSTTLGASDTTAATTPGTTLAASSATTSETALATTADTTAATTPGTTLATTADTNLATTADTNLATTPGTMSLTAADITTTSLAFNSNTTLSRTTFSLPPGPQQTTVVPSVRDPQPEPGGKIAGILCGAAFAAITGSYSSVAAFQMIAIIDSMPCRGEEDGSILRNIGNNFGGDAASSPFTANKLVHYKFLSDDSFSRRILTPLSFTSYEARFVYGSFILLFASVVFYVVTFAILRQFVGGTLTYAVLFFPRPAIFIAWFLLPGLAAEGFRLAIGLDNSADYDGSVDYELRVTGGLALFVCLLLVVAHHIIACYYRPSRMKKMITNHASPPTDDTNRASDATAIQVRSAEKYMAAKGILKGSIMNTISMEGVTPTVTNSTGLGVSHKELIALSTEGHDLRVVNIDGDGNEVAQNGAHRRKSSSFAAAPKSLFEIYNNGSVPHPDTTNKSPSASNRMLGAPPPHILFTGDDGIVVPFAAKQPRGSGVMAGGGLVVDSTKGVTNILDAKRNATRGLLEPPIPRSPNGSSFSASSSPPTFDGYLYRQPTQESHPPVLSATASALQVPRDSHRRLGVHRKSRVAYDPESFSPNQMFLSWEESGHRSDEGYINSNEEFKMDAPPSATAIPIDPSKSSVADSSKDREQGPPRTKGVSAHDWAMKNFGNYFSGRKQSIVTADLRSSDQLRPVAASEGGSSPSGGTATTFSPNAANLGFNADNDGNSCDGDQTKAKKASNKQETGSPATDNKRTKRRSGRLPSDPFAYLAHTISVLTGRTLEPQPSRVILTNKGPIEVVPEQSNAKAIVDPAYLVQPIDNSNFGLLYPLYTAKQRRKNINFFIDILFLPAGNWIAHLSYSLLAIASEYRPRFMVSMVSLHLIRNICVAGLAMYTPASATSCDMFYFMVSIVFFTHGVLVLLTFIYRVPVMNFMHFFESGLLGLYTLAPALDLQGISRTRTEYVFVGNNSSLSNGTAVAVTTTTTVPAADLIFYALCGCVGLSIIFRMISSICETVIMFKVVEAPTSFEWDRFNPPSGFDNNRWITFESLFANPHMESSAVAAEKREKSQVSAHAAAHAAAAAGHNIDITSDGALTNIYSSVGGFDETEDAALAAQAREDFSVSGQDPRRQQRRQWARKQLNQQEQQRKMRSGESDWDIEDDEPPLVSIKSGHLGIKSVSQALQFMKGAGPAKDQTERITDSGKFSNDPWWKRSQSQKSLNGSPKKSPMQPGMGSISKLPATVTSSGDLVRDFSMSGESENDPHKGVNGGKEDQRRPWGGWGQVSQALADRTAKRDEMIELVDLHLQVQKETMWF